LPGASPPCGTKVRQGDGDPVPESPCQGERYAAGSRSAGICTAARPGMHSARSVRARRPLVSSGREATRIRRVSDRTSTQRSDPADGPNTMKVLGADDIDAGETSHLSLALRAYVVPQ